MARYSVIVPIVGSINMVVDAEDPASAIEEALQKNWRLTLDPNDTSEDVEIGEGWAALRQISTGNVLHAEINEAFAEKMKPDEEEGDAEDEPDGD